MPLKINDEISKIDYSLTEVVPNINNNQTYFELSVVQNNIKILIDYVLTPYTDYKPEDYSLFILKSLELNRENDIFQVYDKVADLRIGWIFPIQSLVSNKHGCAENKHFLKYAYVAFYKLLLNQENYSHFTPSSEQIEDYKLTDFYGDNIIILILCKTNIDKIANFNIDNYLASLYSHSYYYCQPTENINKINNCQPTEDLNEIKNRANLKPSGNTRLILQQNSQYLQGEPYIERLFKSLLKTEEHPLVRFYILYQVIELVLEIMFKKSFSDIIDTFQNNTDKNIYELKESIAYISSEKERISKLINALEKYFDEVSKINLHTFCNELLVAFNSKTKETLPSALYSVRSSIVHKFRNLPEKDLPKIEAINKEFENIVIKIILNFEEISI
ncbi:MAG: hypothetical protein ACOVQ3_13465 [Dolichospermum sp.]|jgi:hypothetical protein